jgi:spermidine synthase
MAALFNFLVGSLVFIYIKKLPKIKNVTSREEIQILSNPSKEDTIRFLIVLVLSAITGYISLSQEIIWIRVISYATGGKPDVFAHVLGFFLFGIAFGAIFATKICEQNRIRPINFIAFMFFISSIFYYFSIPLISHFTTFFEQGMIMLYFSIMISAFLIGGIFPVLCHYGIIQPSSVGISLSCIYFANIIGATAGPLVTGFVLLDILSLDKNILFLSIITLIFSGIIFSTTSLLSKTKTLSIASMLVSILVIIAVHSGIYSEIFEKLHYKNEYRNKKPYKYLIENKVGVISVEEGLTDCQKSF